MTGASGLPARGYSWEQAGPGNEISLRHGVFSARRCDPVARELVAGLVADRPDLTAYPELLAAWARAEARCILFADYLTEFTPWSDEGQKVAAWVHRVEGQAERLRIQLGITPGAEAALRVARADAVVRAVDLEAIRDAGQATIEARSVEVES
jgi:hypothetical protein